MMDVCHLRGCVFVEHAQHRRGTLHSNTVKSHRILTCLIARGSFAVRGTAAELQRCFSFHTGHVQNDVPNDPRYHTFLLFAHVTHRPGAVVCCGYEPYVRCTPVLTSYVGEKI